MCRNLVEGNVSFNCETQEIHWAMPAQVQILFVAISIISYDVRVVKEADLNSIIRTFSFFFVCVYVV